MDQKTNSTCSKFKKKGLKTRCTVESVKDMIKKQYRSRLRQLRNEKVDSQRNLANKRDNLEIFKSLVYVESSGLTSADVIEILDEVEKELRLEYVLDEYDEYEKDNNDIIEDLLSTLNVCPVCDKIQSPTVIQSICVQCSETFAPSNL